MKEMSSSNAPIEIAGETTSFTEEAEIKRMKNQGRDRIVEVRERERTESQIKLKKSVEMFSEFAFVA